MATLKETALAYEQQQTMNIADLEKFPVGMELYQDSGTDSEGKEFTFKFAELNGTRYRVPNSVIEQVKTILQLKPDVHFLKVNRTGTGLATRYKVEVVE